MTNGMATAICPPVSRNIKNNNTNKDNNNNNNEIQRYRRGHMGLKEE